MATNIQKYHKIFLLLIILIGIFFRFYDLRTLPPGLYPDEAMNGSNALQALHTGEFKLFYTENNGREGLFINIQALSVKLFGTSAWSLRVVSALFGTLTILGLYLLTKELFGTNFQFSMFNIQSISNIQFSNHIENWKLKTENSRSEVIALLAAFFLATNYWHINFSRIGFRAIMLPFCLTFGLYWLLKGLRTGNIWSLVFGGIAIGAGFQSYIAFRFVPFIIAVPMVWYLWKWLKKRPTTNDQQPTTCVPCAVTLFLFITFVVALPIGIYFLKHTEDFFGRSKEVSIFSSPNPTLAFAISTGKTLQMFNVVGDCNPRHNYRCTSELLWPVGILFLIGIWLTIKYLFRKGALSNPDSFPALCTATIFFFMLFPVILTKEGLPHALRAIGLILPAIMLAAWGGIWLYDTLQNYFSRFLADPKWALRFAQLQRIKKEITVLAFVLLLFIAATAYKTYFVQFRTAPENNDAFRTDITRITDYIVSLPPNTNVYVIANYPDLYYGLPLGTEVIKYRTDTVRKEEQDTKHIHYLMPNELDSTIKSLQPTQKTIFIPMNQSDRTVFSTLKQALPQFSLKIANNFIVIQN